MTVWLILIFLALVVGALIVGGILAVHDSDAGRPINEAVAQATNRASERFTVATNSDFDANSVASRFAGLADVLDELPAIADGGTRTGLSTVAFILAAVFALAAGTLAVVERAERRQSVESCYSAFSGSAVATTPTTASTVPATTETQPNSSATPTTAATGATGASVGSEPAPTTAAVASPSGTVPPVAVSSIDSVAIIRACRGESLSDDASSRREDSEAVARVLARAAANDEPAAGQKVYRRWSKTGGARPDGESWTPVDPRVLELALGRDAFREFAGLPDINDGLQLETCVLADPSDVTRVRAALELGTSRWEVGEPNPGGLVEYVIPNAAKVLRQCHPPFPNPKP